MRCPSLPPSSRFGILDGEIKLTIFFPSMFSTLNHMSIKCALVEFKMGTQHTNSRSSYAYAIAEWRPDMARYRQEVQKAICTGVGDPLTLVEMECSLDLVDADIEALQSGNHETRTLMSKNLALEIRSELQGLITTMLLYCKPN